MLLKALEAHEQNIAEIRHTLLVTVGYEKAVNDPRCFNTNPNSDLAAWIDELNTWINKMTPEELDIYNKYNNEHLLDYTNTEVVEVNSTAIDDYTETFKQLYNTLLQTL